MRSSGAGAVLLKMQRYFEVLLKFFEISQGKSKGSRLVYANKFPSIFQLYFWAETIK